jgi:hypothetical protein
MRLFTLALAATALSALPSTASAAVIATLGTGTGTLLTLSNAGLNGGAVATLMGGSVLNADQPFADIPKGGVFGGNFLAAGPTAGTTATLTFNSPQTYLSFLWGSPDTYNVFTLTTNMMTYTYTTATLGFAVSDGNQAFSQYVQFAASAGETITSASFTNVPSINAFETANFSISPVPEPATWGMMLIGFGMVAGATRYRRRSLRAVYA